MFVEMGAIGAHTWVFSLFEHFMDPRVSPRENRIKITYIGVDLINITVILACDHFVRNPRALVSVKQTADHRVRGLQGIMESLNK